MPISLCLRRADLLHLLGSRVDERPALSIPLTFGRRYSTCSPREGVIALLREFRRCSAYRPPAHDACRQVDLLCSPCFMPEKFTAMRTDTPAPIDLTPRVDGLATLLFECAAAAPASAMALFYFRVNTECSVSLRQRGEYADGLADYHQYCPVFRRH